jgi:hypothetical protein
MEGLCAVLLVIGICSAIVGFVASYVGEVRTWGSGVLLFGGVILAVSSVFILHRMKANNPSAEAVSPVNIGNTATADCPPTSGENGTLPPCVLTQLTFAESTRGNTAYAATCYESRELAIATCLLTRAFSDAGTFGTHDVACRSDKKLFLHAVDQTGRGIGLERITAVRFVKPGTGEEMARVPVEQLPMK